MGKQEKVALEPSNSKRKLLPRATTATLSTGSSKTWEAMRSRKVRPIDALMRLPERVTSELASKKRLKRRAKRGNTLLVLQPVLLTINPSARLIQAPTIEASRKNASGTLHRRRSSAMTSTSKETIRAVMRPSLSSPSDPSKRKSRRARRHP